MIPLITYERLLENISIVTFQTFLICDATGRPVNLISYPSYPLQETESYRDLFTREGLEMIRENVIKFLDNENFVDHFHVQICPPLKDGWQHYQLNFVGNADCTDGKFAVLAVMPLDDHSSKHEAHFIALISHELRTPLTSIIGTLSLLKHTGGDIPEEAAKLLDIAYRNSERLMHLINDLLDMQAMTTSRLTFHYTVADLVSLARKTVETNAGYGEKYGVTFKIIESPPQLMVRCDPMRTTQMVTNLLSNAAKFSPAGSEVEITIEQDGKYGKLTVTDYGEGIPEDFKHRVFERYAQGDNTFLQQKGGTGLGLYITKLIGEKQNGQVGFKSEPGCGSSFYFTVPLEV